MISNIIGFTCSLCLRPIRVLSNLRLSKIYGLNKAVFGKSYYCPVLTKHTCASNIQRFSDYTTSNKVSEDGLSGEHGEIANNHNLKTTNPKNVSLRLSIQFQDQLLNSKLEEYLTRGDEIKFNEWESLKKSVLEIRSSINEDNIDAVFMHKFTEIKSLLLGKSYFKYLSQSGKQINRATYGNYLLLYCACSSSCTKEDLAEINEVYKSLLNTHADLDCYTAEKAVFAICLTSNWREYENLFKTIRLFYQPSVSVYSIVVRTAFKNNDYDLGWKLMEEMKLEGIHVLDEVFVELLDSVKFKGKEKLDHLKRVVEFLKESNAKPSIHLCEVIRKKFEEAGLGRGMFTNISKTGECSNCHAILEVAKVSQEDFDQLRRLFLDPVLIGKDIFQKTKPEEFNEFLNFIKKSSYDIVLDGLNIALRVHKQKRSTSVFASQLRSVVRHFNSLKKTVFVLGRKHMVKWPMKEMQYVFDNAHVFLADDLSHDDPFLLYAALYSGLGTCFVSRDMMRSHKFLLANPKIQSTFQKWQSQHQYIIKYIEPNGNVNLMEPVRYMQSIQCNDRGDWHIPYENKEAVGGKLEPSLYHAHWLCITNPDCAQKREKRPSSKIKSTSKLALPTSQKTGYKVSFDD